MGRSFFRRISILIAAMVALSCDSPTAPIASVYVLRSIANVTLPAAYAPNPNYPNRLISGALILNEDGTGHWEAVAELEVGGATFEFDSELQWSRAGNDLTITLVCNDIASCVAGPHFSGSLSDDRLTVLASNVMRTPLVFEAVFQSNAYSDPSARTRAGSVFAARQPGRNAANIASSTTIPIAVATDTGSNGAT